MLTVPDTLRGALLQDFLGSALPAVDRAALRRLQAAGAVRVNGMPAVGNPRLRPNDQVEIAAAKTDLPPVPAARGRAGRPALRVLFESATCLCIDKPAGVPSVPDRSGNERGVHGQLPALRPDADLRIAHRLDRDTSGCLLLAKGLPAARHFDLAFRSGRVHKEYVALVQGEVDGDERTIDQALGADRRRPGLVVTGSEGRKGFRSARTELRVEARYAGFTLVRLCPKTGRGHQLRVHLAAIGHPIAADADYGGGPLLLSALKPGYKSRPGVVERPLLARMFLHAQSLQFPDLDGEPVAVQAPLPDDLRQALDKVARFRARGH